MEVDEPLPGLENVENPELNPENLLKPEENEEKKEVGISAETTLQPEIPLTVLENPNREEDSVKIEDKAVDINPEDILAELVQDAGLLTDAKNDIKNTDVIVCGTCYNVFHFVEEFQKHKLERCAEVTNLENEGKPQVWGFSLWKHKQFKTLQPGEVKPSSWAVYQNWCKLPSAEKQAWILAGENLQVCNKIGNALVENKKDDLDDVRKGLRGPVRLNSDVTIHPSSKGCDTNKAIKILRESIRQECTVEKIVAKRFNPRRKTFEYQVKWANFDSSENTWETPGNLASCKKMIEDFEENLKKIKAEQKLNGTQPKGRGRPRLSASAHVNKSYTPANISVSSVPSSDLTPGRPQRASKQKALNQVKSWCGNISDTDEGGGKRPYDDDDSDDSFEKKIRLEDYSDSEDEQPKYPLKKVPKVTTTTVTTQGQAVSILNNGIGGNKLPQNVLIPDANGVVRINQKQLPSLSTGVYIMSKTAGIIKLDSTTSKVATSGGQTIVKVAPKIGETHIKIVKKDGQTTNKIIQMSTPKMSVPNKTYKPVITKIKKSEGDKPKVNNVKQKEEQSKPLVQIPPMDDHEESDDGLPELEFPTDLPLPEPDSPPGEFVLDPETGKIVGQEYQDKPVVISEPPTVETSLENIVKLAAADITEDDLKTEPSLITSNISTGDELKSVDEAQTDTSILNKALTNSNILQKTLVSPKSKTPQRILNHSITPRSQTMTPTIRQTNQNMIRSKPQTPKPKFNIASTITKVADQGVRNVYSKTTTPTANQNVAMRGKIGQTSVYRNVNNKTPQSRLAQSGPNLNVYKASPRQSPTKSKPVINMPSLIGDDDQVMASTSAQAVDNSVTSETPVETDLSSFSLAENESPIYITGDDGTVYQVAGQNEQGQTILITQGTDGQQQCLLVTNEPTPEEAQAVEDTEEITEAESSKLESDLSNPLTVKTDEPGDQVVAQVVRAEPPSPGGTHKVVVMLPDGNLMVTQVSPEEYASLELE